LEQHGFLKKRSNTSPLKVLKSTLVRLLPGKLLTNVRQSIPKNVVNLAHDTDWRSTRAFGHNYIDGIYLNDQRFGGPVKNNQLEALVDEICDLFNSDPTAVKYGVTANPYRRKFTGRAYADHLPDIKLDKGDELHCVGVGEFIRSNPNYGPIPPLSEVKEDMFTGQKGSRPLFMVNKDLASMIEPDDSRDLTLVYKLTERLFKQS
jgi:hypothetical protein